MRETAENAIISDDGLSVIERSLSRFHHEKISLDRELERVYRRIDEHLQLSMPRNVDYENSRSGLANRISTRRRAIRNFSYDTSEL
jgi:hypothetical protein